MMRWILLIAAALTAIVLEVTLFDRLSIANARPDLPLSMALLIAATSRRFDLVCLATWITGLLVDLLSGARFGTFSILFLLAALTAYGLKQLVSGDAILGQMFLVGLLVLSVDLAHGLIATWSFRDIGVDLVARQAAVTALYSAALVPLLRWMGRPVLLKFGREAEWLH
mgnify:CR=1 FL=1